MRIPMKRATYSENKKPHYRSPNTVPSTLA
jgi:hypothetical protein